MNHALLRCGVAALALALSTFVAGANAFAQRGVIALDVRTARLENGLRVVLVPDRTSPTVAVAIYYDVGSRVEERGRSGFAHLFEHMMFEGSFNAPRGTHDRLVSLYGGDSNGTTSEDRTNYYETFPSNAVELGLFLEADRLRALDVTAESFANQRETVMEERRQSYDNEPYMLALLRRDEVAYGDYWPYAHSVIGDMADLQRADFQTVRAFHARYYVPGNAVLAVAGNIDPDATSAQVRLHFGDIETRPVPRFVDPGFTGQRSERIERVEDRHAELPAFYLAWHIPPRRTPDHYALEVLADVLGGGHSSRLYRELVRNAEVLESVSVDTEDRRGPDLFGCFGIVTAAHTPAAVRQRVYAQIESIARSGISGAELARSRNRIRSAMVFGLQSNRNRAMRAAEFEMYDGNARLVRTEGDRYAAVTSDDVRRVAATYLTASNRTVIDVVPTPPDTLGGASAGGGR